MKRVTLSGLELKEGHILIHWEWSDGQLLYTVIINQGWGWTSSRYSRGEMEEIYGTIPHSDPIMEEVGPNERLFVQASPRKG